jgi:hypothetical protein
MLKCELMTREIQMNSATQRLQYERLNALAPKIKNDKRETILIFYNCFVHAFASLLSRLFI